MKKLKMIPSGDGITNTNGYVLPIEVYEAIYPIFSPIKSTLSFMFQTQPTI